jgi:biopolymer transport protein ExbD
MAEKKRLLDVWVVEINTVYREVPFTVVTDWLTEGRLLAEDRVRLTGTTAWHQAGKVPAFGPYLPKTEPHRAEDKAEALEPVDMGFTWKNPAEAEDEDVDMIPLIDISLVLLIFFMMTASVSSGVFSPINTPPAKHQLGVIAKDMVWIGVDSKDQEGRSENDATGKPVTFYSLGIENATLELPTPRLNDVLARLEGTIAEQNLVGKVRLRIRADENLPIETVSKTTLELQGLERKMNRQRDKAGKLTFEISGEVSEPKSQ